METATINLLKAIDKERGKRQMSVRKFSMQVLGISHSYLSLLNAGKRPLTPNLAVMFMQKLPELAPAVTIFIMSQGDNHETMQKLENDPTKSSLKKLSKNRAQNKGSNSPRGCNQ